MSVATPTDPVSAEDLLELIEQEAFRLRYAWANFRMLFASEKKTVDVLNATAPGFFAMVQRLLVDDVILRIARLTDPPAHRSQENATLKRLLQATDWAATDPARHAAFAGKIAAVDAACADCKTHRHKRLAHPDLKLARGITRLPDATLKMIDGAVAAIEAFTRDIHLEIHPGVSRSFEIINGDRDVKRLLRRLENRASRERPDAVSTITHEGGKNAQFTCAFCGQTSDIPFYPNGTPTPRRIVRWHYDDCHGVVGDEVLSVEVIDRTGAAEPSRFTVELSRPTHKTDAEND